jgi:UDP-N-acetyl-D-glucosamine dehydrogenase
MLICVPTPLGPNNTPDLQYIHSTLKSIKKYLKKGQLLILESTTYPGTTEEEIVPEVEKNNFKIGTDFFIAYSPEREDPGNPDYSTQTIPKVVSGHTQNCCEVANSLYKCIVDETVTVSSTKVAEMTKLLENIHRAVNIGLVNELKMVADKMDIDIFEVIKTAATKPFGFTPFYPGPGLGGHCIPIDPFYLTWKAKQVGVTTRFIELAGEVNTNMPQWVLEKAEIGLLNRGLKISESKVLILGMAYKKNVDDLRESPSLELIRLLSERGVDADYHDFYILKLHHTRKYSFDKSSINLNESIGNYDLIILSTDHDEYDYEYLQKNSKLIVDTRGRFKGSHSNIISA